MIEKIDQIEQAEANNFQNTGDIRVAISLLREQMAAQKIVAEDFPLDDFGINSYMPFMNFLQNRDFENVRRFLLIHPRVVTGGQWDVAANGVFPPTSLSDPRLKCIPRRNLIFISRLRNSILLCTVVVSRKRIRFRVLGQFHHFKH